MKTDPGGARHEPDVRHWPQIAAHAVVLCLLAAGTAALMWGAMHGSTLDVVHGHPIAVADPRGRDAWLGGWVIIAAAALLYAGGFIGYSIRLYEGKLPLELKVDAVAVQVGDVYEGLGRVEELLTPEVAAQAVRQRGAHRRLPSGWRGLVR